jgi:hypothetical protein
MRTLTLFLVHIKLLDLLLTIVRKRKTFRVSFAQVVFRKTLKGD